MRAPMWYIEGVIRRIVLTAFALLAVAVGGCGGEEETAQSPTPVADQSPAPVAAPSAAKAPVIKLKDEQFGDILATPGRRALYYWDVEKKAGGKVRCTGSCAAAWPPLIVRSAAAVPKRVSGIAGTFGVIRRPDGRLQVTHRGLPIYTYAHEGPNEVLCNDVDGWFVVRV
jgi:predicted lipoprotein with Yx(FWY)xxD motif